MLAFPIHFRFKTAHFQLRLLSSPSREPDPSQKWSSLGARFALARLAPRSSLASLLAPHSPRSSLASLLAVRSPRSSLLGRLAPRSSRAELLATSDGESVAPLKKRTELSDEL